jgi:uncharacterized protein (TIGR03086 family)
LTDRSDKKWGDPVDIRNLDRRAIEATGAIVAALTDAQLDLPTPCAEWTARELVGHLVDNNRGLLRRVGGEVPERTGDPRVDYRASAEALVRAFADDAALAVRVPMPAAGRDVSGRTALTVHFSDVLVHGWDLARAVGDDHAFDPELASAAAEIVGRFPDGVWAEGGAVFAPRRAVAPDADPSLRLLGLTGRDQGWTPA